MSTSSPLPQNPHDDQRDLPEQRTIGHQDHSAQMARGDMVANIVSDPRRSRSGVHQSQQQIGVSNRDRTIGVQSIPSGSSSSTDCRQDSVTEYILSAEATVDDNERTKRARVKR